MAKQGHWQKMSDDEGNEFEAWVDGVLPPPSEGAEQDSESLPEPADVEPTENANTQDPVSIFGDVDREPAPQEQEFDLPSASEDAPQPTPPAPSFVPDSPTPPPEREPISPEFTPAPAPTGSVPDTPAPSPDSAPANESSSNTESEESAKEIVRHLAAIEAILLRHDSKLDTIAEALQDGITIQL